MRTTLIFSTLLFLLLSVTSFCRIKGTWRQVFPEENGEIPGPRFEHYMCPIGDGKVLMVGGGAGGFPHYYNETWLYDYEDNTWTKVECDSMPDLYSASDYRPNEGLYQIAENMILSVGSILVAPGLGGWKLWLFHLDSMKWYGIHDSNTVSALYLGDNVWFNYSSYDFAWKRYGVSSLVRPNFNEPFQPNFLTKEIINDEWTTRQGFYSIYGYMIESSHDEVYFTYYNNKKVTWIPTIGLMIIGHNLKTLWDWISTPEIDYF